MSQDVWSAVDALFCERLVPSDAALDNTLSHSEAEGLPQINVAPNQGKFLHLLARIHGAKRILEIGTLGGYSTIWFAKALPADGSIITLEFDPHHAEVARANIDRAGFSSQVEVRVGAAIDSLPILETEGTGPFDLVFIDADKASMPQYLEWAIRLSRPGTVIIGDNVVRGGEVLDEQTESDDVRGVQKMLAMMSGHPRLSATAIQTVGSKGYDGFAMTLVLE